ncbi:MAG: fimbrial protein FimV [Polaromonas sp.]|nr:fimbrial protein FimV [Polaromonas sp.]
MNNRVRWRLGALASAIALIGSFTSFEAQALGLGRITVQSSLGEPLRAEIDIVEINADEAASLKAGVASPDAFKAAGLDYSTAVSDMRVSLQRRADGRVYLRLSSNRAVTEPFVDLILEANWSSGRIVRDYTMLFDPPNLRSIAGVAVTPTAPGVARSTVPIPSAAGLGSIPYSPPVSNAARAAAPVAAATPAAAPKVAPPKPATSGQQVAIKAGDTAGKIAAQTKPASISLDQMLVALLRSNPDAFIAGNINRLKSGAVLDIPDVDAASSITAGEASRTIIAQSKDFNEFRRKLAESVPATQVSAANRQAGGKVQAKVEDRASGTTTPDKLTLSKGAIKSKAAAEDKIAKERQAKEASARVAELAKNIGDLNKLATAPPSAATAAAASASAAKAPVLAVAKPALLAASVAAPAPAMATASAPKLAAISAATTVASSTPPPATSTPTAPVATVATAATATAATPTVATPTVATIAASAPAAVVSPPVAVASQPVAPSGAASAQAPVVKKPVAAQPPPEPSLIDELTENPFVLPGLAVVLALLAGFGFYRFRQRNNATQVDSSFLESRLQPDSFFGASGGQRIDTNEGGATGSSLVYSPSQLDAAGDVDPVAEADVYLAYGRDLQAEEILKEALRTNPTRVAIHSKLMEIYAKRRDAKAFEVVAMEAFNLTRGEGSEWAFMAEMGRELDPSNPMYQPGGQPAVANHKNSGGASGMASAFAGAATVPQMIQPQHEDASSAVDFDLDLDFSIGDEAVAAAPVAAPVKQQTAARQPPEPTMAIKPQAAPIFDGLDLDFGTDTVALKPVISTPVQASPPPPPAPDADEMLAGGLTFTAEPISVPKPAPVAAAAPAVMDSGMLEFDLGSLSLDLDGPTTESPVITAAGALGDGPLETKFALAEEFRALGDMDGARALAEEVMAQAQGSLKSKAQAFINALS